MAGGKYSDVYFLEILCSQIKIFPQTIIEPKYGEFGLNHKVSVTWLS